MAKPSNHRLAERRLVKMVERGIWSIGTDGHVRWALARATGRPGRLAEKNLKAGYVMVRAMIDGVRVVGLAHRLVWQALRGDIPEGMVINHINGFKNDNRIENLEVATYSHNAEHAHRVLGVSPQHGQHNPGSKLSATDVAEIRAARARGDRPVDIAKRFGIRYQHVYRLCNGERWGHLRSPKALTP